MSIYSMSATLKDEIAIHVFVYHDCMRSIVMYLFINVILALSSLSVVFF
jgi:hypothetical protein